MKKIVKFIILIIILAALGAFIYISSFYFKGKEEITLNVGDSFKNEAKIYSFFKDVTNKVTIENNINNKELGDYTITYTYKILFLNRKKVVTAHVIDNEGPVISLNDGDKIETYLNEEYVDPGYSATDNYDKDIEVKVVGDVDTSKAGSYYLKYQATDSSGNNTEVVRKVIVSKVSPLALDVKEFNLNDYFKDTILQESDVRIDGYMDDIIFAGDSVVWKFGLKEKFDPKRVWGKPCEGPFNFKTQKMVVNNTQTKYTFAELVEQNKPKYLLIHMGICDCNGDDPITFQNEYEKVIDYIREVSPDTKIIIMSLMPQTAEHLSEIPKRNNTIINKYNYYLVELCKKKNVPFLNAAEAVKDKNGQGREGWFLDDGYHPNGIGMKAILKYIETHQYVEGR